MCALALGAIACGGSTPPPVRPARPEVGPLVTLVPPGSTLVVVTRPSELMSAEATRRIVTAMFPAEQLDRFAQRTGVDPRSLSELVIAEHREGRLVLARGSIDARFAVREAGERMAPLEAAVERPMARRAGFLGERRVDVTALAPDVVLWVEGTPQLAARVLASARRSPRERRHALSGVRALREAHAGAPIALHAPHPLGLAIDTGIGMLLAREEALAVSARPTEGGALRIVAELRGEFPPSAHDNFRALARSLAETDLGAALGARDALPSLRIEADDHRVVLHAELDPAVLAAGLRALLVAELRELLAPFDGVERRGGDGERGATEHDASPRGGVPPERTPGPPRAAAPEP